MNQVQALAKMIDHAVLHPTQTKIHLEEAADMAKKFDIASLCVKPYMVPYTAQLLAGSDIKVCAVVGFPSGSHDTKTKVYEATNLCMQGATEIDFVVNVGKVLSQDWDYIKHEVEAITHLCHSNGALVKAIFETDYIHKVDHIKKLCAICTEATTDFVKTSTGFGFVKTPDGHYTYKGATIPHLSIMLESVGPDVGVKASGGVRTLDQILAIQELGCQRCGTSSTVSILNEAIERFGGVQIKSLDHTSKDTDHSY